MLNIFSTDASPWRQIVCVRATATVISRWAEWFPVFSRQSVNLSSLSLIGNETHQKLFGQQMRAKHVFVAWMNTSSETVKHFPFYYFQTQLPSKLWGIGSFSVSEVNRDAFALTPSSLVQFVGGILMLLAACSLTAPYWIAASVFRSVSGSTVCPLLAVK